MNTKLYVGNLPYETTEADLQALFASSGEVSTVNLVRDRYGPGAWVRVRRNGQYGRRAARHFELHQRPFGGRNLTVNEAKPMTARAEGSGFGRQRRDPRCRRGRPDRCARRAYP